LGWEVCLVMSELTQCIEILIKDRKKAGEVRKLR
jgi:hypothetical protein